MALIPKLALAGDGSPSPRKDPAAVSKKITFLASEIDTESFSSNFSMSGYNKKDLFQIIIIWLSNP